MLLYWNVPLRERVLSSKECVYLCVRQCVTVLRVFT